MNSTIDRLRTILVRDYKLAPESLTPDTPLDSLGIDSLGVAELLFNIEDEFKISLPPEPVQLETVGDVVRFVDGLAALQSDKSAQPSAPTQAQIGVLGDAKLHGS